MLFQSNIAWGGVGYYCYRMTVDLLGVYVYLGSQEEAIFKK
jgi:hypothetical protein